MSTTLSSKTSMYTLLIQFEGESKPHSRHSMDNSAKAKRAATKGKQQLLDNYIGNPKYKWAWACLRNNHTSEIEEYYHSSKGNQPITKDKYIAAKNNNQYNLYIIHKTHSKKPETIKDCRMDEVPQYYASDVSKIHLYRGRTLKWIYNGQWQKAD